MQNYNFLQRNLHRFILGNKFLKKSLFDIEKSIFLKKQEDLKEQKHIFISGLPRSGTTIILEFIYQTKEFASLTYADMPFILSPNLFSKISRKQNIQFQERMHQDGIIFNLKSPDAFDEVFFQTFNNDECYENLEIFVSLVLQKYKKNRYLSKNNNNYKRIKLILSVFPNATIFIPHRDPLQHAYSLLCQHQHFYEIQKKDKFVLEYMNFLGHNEFGLNYKSWNLSDKYCDPSTLNHWLEQWHLFYQVIIKNYKNNKNVILISYDELCNNSKLITSLVLKLDFNKSYDKKFFKLSKKVIRESFDEQILLRCIETQKQLKNLSNHLI